MRVAVRASARVSVTKCLRNVNISEMCNIFRNVSVHIARYLVPGTRHLRLSCGSAGPVLRLDRRWRDSITRHFRSRSKASPQDTMARVRNVCFTLNNPDVEDIGALPWPTPLVKYAVWQLERGDEGTLHIQGYFEMSEQLRFPNIKQRIPFLSRAHFEPRRGTAQQATEYCEKEDTRVDGGYPFAVTALTVSLSDMLCVLRRSVAFW